MKNFEEYLNDDDIQRMPEYLREIHAIRKAIAEETSGLSVDETNNLLREEAAKAFSELGLPPPRYENLAGKGRIRKDEPILTK
jgi:hypothetical protein